MMRYVSAIEAFWRLSQFPMQCKSHVVERLAMHLPYEQQVYFAAGEEQAALDKALRQDSTLTAYFKKNLECQQQYGEVIIPLDEASVEVDSRNLLYHEMPKYFTFRTVDKQRKWCVRQRGGARTIGRMYTVSPSQPERYHLRLLLLHVRGAVSFEHLRTVNGVDMLTFTAAAHALGLLIDDEEWRRCLREASIDQMPARIRELFAIILIFNNPSAPVELWNEFNKEMIDDYMRKNRNLSVEEATAMAYYDIAGRLSEQDKIMTDFIPKPSIQPPSLADIIDVDGEKIEADRLYKTLNEQQQQIFDSIVNSINNVADDRLYYIDGPGGSGNELFKSFEA